MREEAEEREVDPDHRSFDEFLEGWRERENFMRESPAWRHTAGGEQPARSLEVSSREALKEVVSAAACDGIAILPCCHGARLDRGWPPRSYDLALSLRGMNAVLEHDVGDFTVTAEAGVSVGELVRVLAEKGQRLPLEVDRPDETSLGGLVSADVDSLFRRRFGRVRDLLLGLHAIWGEGRELHAGGRVVKNVAGYDTSKVYVGAFGTLGIVTQVTLRTAPLPESRAMVTCPGLSVEEGFALFDRLRAGGADPSAAEWLDEDAAETLGVADVPCAILLFEGLRSVVEESLRHLSSIESSAVRVEEGEAEALLRALADFAAPSGEDALVLRASVRPSRAVAFDAALRRSVGAGMPALESSLRHGNGIAHYQLSGWREVDARQVADLVERLRGEAADQGGSLQVLSCPPAAFGVVDPWGPLSSETLHRRLKGSLDPHRIFAPGRFAGRI